MRIRCPRDGLAGRHPGLLAAPLLLLLAAGCQTPPGHSATGGAASGGAEALNPIAGTTQAPPVGPAGEPMRVQRSYFAASGRECREVVLGTGVGERAALLCQDGAGGWTPARPLLRGGGGAFASGIARP